jgi:hypothetical protein
MLEQMRNNSGNLITYTLFSMIIIVFIFTFGAVDPSEACRGGAVEQVAEIGKSKINEKDLSMAARLMPDFPPPRSTSQRAIFDRINYRQFRYPFTPLSGKYVNRSRVCQGIGCVDFGMRPVLTEFSLDPREIPIVVPQKALEHLTETLLVSHAADELGLVTSNTELRDRVKPQFLTTEKTFDKDLWLAHVNRSGAGASRYEAFLKQELQREKLIALSLSGLIVTDYELGFYHRLTNEKVRIEFVSVSDDMAKSMLTVNDADVTSWLADAKNQKEANDFYTKDTKSFENPKRFVFQAASVVAGPGKEAIEKEADIAKKAELEAARKANSDKAGQLAAAKPDPSNEASVFQFKDMTEADITKTFGEEVATALAALKAGDAGQVIETADAFVVVHLTKVVEASTQSFDVVKNDIARSLVAASKAAEFKKTLADALFAAAKTDAKASLADHVKALNAKYGAEDDGLSVSDSGLVARAFSNTALYPFTTSLDRGSSIKQLGAVGMAGTSQELLKAAFAGSKEAALLPKVYEMDGSKNLVVAKFIELQEAGKMEDVNELRDQLLNDKEQNTYLAWYGQYRTDKAPKVTAYFEKLVNDTTKTWIEGGGTVAGMQGPVAAAAVPPTP